MDEKLGWYELHNNKDGITFSIYSKFGAETCSPVITINFIEDFKEGDWFAESMEINNPAIEEFNELSIKILNCLNKDPDTIKQMTLSLDVFLDDKAIAPLE